MLLISEAGLYRVIMRTQKPAERFTDWWTAGLNQRLQHSP